ncbi:hypothetical protein N0V90_008884 [Kalmusia sp. IMI 367209]|nr:hypothetical protein N0V90_008884 [Kalmusia sp. IMI 367209]
MNAYKFTHAHPPTPPKQGNHSSERMTTIDFQLRGLHGMGKSQVTDIYCPQVRRSRFHEEYSVNHLDVVSCWKRLSLSQATEVINWERLFCDVLEVHISDSVRDSILASSTINGGYLQTTRFVEVDLSKLVHDMIGLHFAHKPDWQYTKPWFMSNSDLPAMVYNFLRTRDCFIETSPQPCVQLDFVCSPSLIIGEVIWQPPNINFGDIPRALSSGSLYSVQPDYHSPDLGNSSGPRFASFPDDVSFTADSQSLLLEWECAEQSITAIVPSLDDIGRSTKTMFTIKSVIQFPGGVRYERISRYNIRLLITNRETNILYQPIKRKAVEQFPISSMFDTTEFFEASRLALDSLDDECLEFTAGTAETPQADMLGDVKCLSEVDP